MDQFGNDFDSATGSVMTRKQLEEQRRKRGECVTCGRKCFQKKLFKTIPITDHGRVLNGRCLNCHPLKAGDNGSGAVMPAVSRRATSQDLERFNRTQSNLATVDAGRRSVRRQSTRTRDSYRRGNSSRSLPPVARHSRSMDDISMPGFESVPSGSQSVASVPNPAPVGRPSHDSAASVPLSLPPPPPPPISPPINSASFRSRLSQDSSHEDSNYYYSGNDSIEEPPEEFTPNIRDDYPPHVREGEHYIEDYSDSYGESAEDPRGRDLGSHFQQSPVRSSSRGRQSMVVQGTSQTSIRSAESVSSDPGVNAGYDHQDQYYDQQEQYQQDQYDHPDDIDPHQQHDSRVLNRGGTYNHDVPPPPAMEHSPSPHLTPKSRYARNNSRGASQRMESNRSISSGVSSVDGSGSFRSPLHAHQEHHPQDVVQQQEQRVEQHPHYADRQYADRQWTHPDFSNHSEHDYHDDVCPPGDESERVDDRYSPGVDQQQQQQQQQGGGSGVGMAHLRAAGNDFVEILNVMRDFPDDIEVQSSALHELSEIELSEGDNEVLTQIGGIAVIVNSMASFPSELDLQISGCRAVWNASGTAQNQHDFVEQSVLDIILPAMGDFIDDANLQEQAMAALANLAALQVNLEIMVEKGAVELVVESMNKHGDSPHVQMKGCLVVANLSSHPTNLKQVIMEKGGGNALVIAMVIHENEAELQEKALRGLRNLSANCDQNKVEITNIGGIDAVIGAMRVHRDAASVQEAGAWTLSNLGGNADSNALIGDCGGVEVIIRAMWVHAETVSVVEWCCRALYTMALDERNGDLILEVGGISAVINAMQAHVDDSAVVQEMGCAVLCNLATNDQCKMRIVDEEALDAIVLAMVLYSEEERVQERGCQVLLQLAIAENLRSMQASNATELVRGASEKFPESCGEPAERLLEAIESYIAEYG